MTDSFLFDARVLAEPNPTGVTVVANQFLQRLRELQPDISLITAQSARSNTLRNARYALGMLTAAHSGTIVLPNFNFIHVSPHVRRIQVVHDLSFIHAPYWYGPKSRLWHAALRIRTQLELAHRIIAVSAWTHDDIVHTFSISPDKIRVVHPHTPQPVEPQQPQLPFSDEPFFLFLGTLESRKNVAGVIEAFSLARTTPALKHYHLVLAGRNGFGAPPVASLPPHVHVLSYLDEPHKWWLLRHATALVYPSFFEGFGLPPLEAAAARCPVITSDRTALPETMHDGALYVSPYDISQIVIALEALATDEQMRAHYIERGAARAAWYSVERQRSSLSEALANIS